MTRVRSFAPIADGKAIRLILGSMPGVASLRAREYYAHPRNQFWRVIGELLGRGQGASYTERAGALNDAGIALWDVLKTCTCPGSLDADIDAATVIPNNFASFFAAHPRIGLVAFNGLTAERLFRRHVLPVLSQRPLV